MSRNKNRNRKPEPLITAEDLGGLDLSVAALPPPPPAQPLPEPILDTPVQPAPGPLPTGHTLFNAIEQSGYTHLAAHPSGIEGVVVVSNGLRFWTADARNLEPVVVEYFYDFSSERSREDWRPILGNENGLYIS